MIRVYQRMVMVKTDRAMPVVRNFRSRYKALTYAYRLMARWEGLFDQPIAMEIYSDRSGENQTDGESVSKQ